MELSQAISSTHLMCKSFRKRSFLNGIPIFYVGDDSGFFDNADEDEEGKKIGVWKDILELAHDYLLDGDMLGFRQRPADGERDIAAASMLERGMGPDTWRNILKVYKIVLVPRGDCMVPLDRIPGMGPKRCKLIEHMVWMVYK